MNTRETQSDYLGYFSDNAKSWTAAAHEGSNGNYPLGGRRAELALGTLQRFHSGGGNVVDFGSGPGIFAASLAATGYHVVGVDFSRAMVDLAMKDPRCRRQLDEGSLDFLVGPWEESIQNFEPLSIDVVTALGFVYYLGDILGFFNAVSLLLPPGGVLVVSFRNRDFDRSRNLLAAQVRSIITQLSSTELEEAVSTLISSLDAIQGAKEITDPVPRISNASHTVAEASTFGRSSGFSVVEVSGLHPHLLHPLLDRDEMAEIVDTLSRPLDLITESEIRWFSHFLVTYKKD